ncbi:hypothetical protein ADUPG1_006458 [Aduncisulcus paluster]|uniref:Uncharacterized protein n=1 Tax=Aduncisulcus paluster TaxID=2918883 RepID=A0ABQ5KIC0_9EUKA|nr:hypothetical protein ADUPG1_006458 [Aduncisulcus paluster]
MSDRRNLKELLHELSHPLPPEKDVEGTKIVAEHLLKEFGDKNESIPLSKLLSLDNNSYPKTPGVIFKQQYEFNHTVLETIDDSQPIPAALSGYLSNVQLKAYAGSLPKLECLWFSFDTQLALFPHNRRDSSFVLYGGCQDIITQCTIVEASKRIRKLFLSYFKTDYRYVIVVATSSSIHFIPANKSEGQPISQMIAEEHSISVKSPVVVSSFATMDSIVFATTNDSGSLLYLIDVELAWINHFEHLKTPSLIDGKTFPPFTGQTSYGFLRMVSESMKEVHGTLSASEVISIIKERDFESYKEAKALGLLDRIVRGILNYLNKKVIRKVCDGHIRFVDRLFLQRHLSAAFRRSDGRKVYCDSVNRLIWVFSKSPSMLACYHYNSNPVSSFYPPADAPDGCKAKVTRLFVHTGESLCFAGSLALERPMEGGKEVKEFSVDDIKKIMLEEVEGDPAELAKLEKELVHTPIPVPAFFYPCSIPHLYGTIVGMCVLTDGTRIPLTLRFKNPDQILHANPLEGCYSSGLFRPSTSLLYPTTTFPPSHVPVWPSPCGCVTLPALLPPFQFTVHDVCCSRDTVFMCVSSDYLVLKEFNVLSIRRKRGSTCRERKDLDSDRSESSEEEEEEEEEVVDRPGEAFIRSRVGMVGEKDKLKEDMITVDGDSGELPPFVEEVHVKPLSSSKPSLFLPFSISETSNNFFGSTHPARIACIVSSRIHVFTSCQPRVLFKVHVKPLSSSKPSLFLPFSISETSNNFFGSTHPARIACIVSSRIHVFTSCQPRVLFSYVWNGRRGRHGDFKRPKELRKSPCDDSSSYKYLSLDLCDKYLSVEALCDPHSPSAALLPPLLSPSGTSRASTGSGSSSSTASLTSLLPPSMLRLCIFVCNVWGPRTCCEELLWWIMERPIAVERYMMGPFGKGRKSSESHIHRSSSYDAIGMSEHESFDRDSGDSISKDHDFSEEHSQSYTESGQYSITGAESVRSGGSGKHIQRTSSKGHLRASYASALEFIVRVFGHMSLSGRLSSTIDSKYAYAMPISSSSTLYGHVTDQVCHYLNLSSETYVIDASCAVVRDLLSLLDIPVVESLELGDSNVISSRLCNILAFLSEFGFPFASSVTSMTASSPSSFGSESAFKPIYPRPLTHLSLLALCHLLQRIAKCFVTHGLVHNLIDGVSATAGLPVAHQGIMVSGHDVMWYILYGRSVMVTDPDEGKGRIIRHMSLIDYGLSEVAPMMFDSMIKETICACSTVSLEMPTLPSTMVLCSKYVEEAVRDMISLRSHLHRSADSCFLFPSELMTVISLFRCATNLRYKREQDIEEVISLLETLCIPESLPHLHKEGTGDEDEEEEEPSRGALRGYVPPMMSLPYSCFLFPSELMTVISLFRCATNLRYKREQDIEEVISLLETLCIPESLPHLHKEGTGDEDEEEEEPSRGALRGYVPPMMSLPCLLPLIISLVYDFEKAAVFGYSHRALRDARICSLGCSVLLHQALNVIISEKTSRENEAKERKKEEEFLSSLHSESEDEDHGEGEEGTDKRRHSESPLAASEDVSMKKKSGQWELLVHFAIKIALDVLKNEGLAVEKDISKAQSESVNLSLSPKKSQKPSTTDLFSSSSHSSHSSPSVSSPSVSDFHDELRTAIFEPASRFSGSSLGKNEVEEEGEGDDTPAPFLTQYFSRPGVVSVIGYMLMRHPSLMERKHQSGVGEIKALFAASLCSSECPFHHLALVECGIEEECLLGICEGLMTHSSVAEYLAHDIYLSNISSSALLSSFPETVSSACSLFTLCVCLWRSGRFKESLELLLKCIWGKEEESQASLCVELCGHSLLNGLSVSDNVVQGKSFSSPLLTQKHTEEIELETERAVNNAIENSVSTFFTECDISILTYLLDWFGMSLEDVEEEEEDIGFGGGDADLSAKDEEEEEECCHGKKTKQTKHGNESERVVISADYSSDEPFKGSLQQIRRNLASANIVAGACIPSSIEQRYILLQLVQYMLEYGEREWAVYDEKTSRLSSTLRMSSHVHRVGMGTSITVGSCVETESDEMRKLRVHMYNVSACAEVQHDLFCKMNASIFMSSSLLLLLNKLPLPPSFLADICYRTLEYEHLLACVFVCGMVDGAFINSCMRDGGSSAITRMLEPSGTAHSLASTTDGFDASALMMLTHLGEDMEEDQMRTKKYKTISEEELLSDAQNRSEKLKLIRSSWRMYIEHKMDTIPCCDAVEDVLFFMYRLFDQFYPYLVLHLPQSSSKTLMFTHLLPVDYIISECDKYVLQESKEDSITKYGECGRRIHNVIRRVRDSERRLIPLYNILEGILRGCVYVCGCSVTRGVESGVKASIRRLQSLAKSGVRDTASESVYRVFSLISAFVVVSIGLKLDEKDFMVRESAAKRRDHSNLISMAFQLNKCIEQLIDDDELKAGLKTLRRHLEGAFEELK